MYQIFRMRGMVDHYEKTGILSLEVEEPWKSKMIEYKHNYHNPTGQSMFSEIGECLVYLKTYYERLVSK